MLEKEKNKLILSKYKLKEGILNVFSAKSPKHLKLYKDFLDENLKTLKRINTTDTRKNIEMKLYNQSSIPAFDWQLKLVSLNNIFAMMLGIIDARNDYYKRCKDFYQTFDDIKEIQNIEVEENKLIEYRNKITNDYQLFLERDDMTVIKETIVYNPSYEKFDILFKDMKKNSYNLVIQGQLISAYMFGYNKSLCIFPQDIIPYYNKIISAYKLDKAKNNFDYQKMKKI